MEDCFHFDLRNKAVLNYEQRNAVRPGLQPNPIKYTFAMLGSYRNYNAFSGAFSVSPNRLEPQRNVNARIREETTKSSDNSEPAVFELVKMKVGYRFLELLHEGGEAAAKEAIKTQEPFSSINKLVQKHLRITLNISVPDLYAPNNILLTLKDERGWNIEAGELSAGEKGILHFIFSLYGYDLKNGVMIIDEPELHLHPQIQKQYLRIIKEVRGEFDLQFIIATHSPLFIEKDTIANVYRFYLDADRYTKVIKPTITEDQKNLVRFLTYTNSAKIFFVNKVILVEGDTDEYFYRFYLDWLKENADPAVVPWKDNIQDFEILNIGGKEEFEKWIAFLERFELKVYSIADLDKIEKGKSTTQLLELKNINLIRWAEIQTKIQEKYANGFFIFKEGDLEKYLGITKGLDKVIEFCEQGFDTWRASAMFEPLKAEIDDILRRIFTI